MLGEVQDRELKTAAVVEHMWIQVQSPGGGWSSQQEAREEPGIWVTGSQMARSWVVACLALMHMTVYVFNQCLPIPQFYCMI